MASILATVDIEDLATAKVSGIKDALTDLASTQQQVAAQSAAMGASMQGAITAMGSQATAAQQAAGSFQNLLNQMMAAAPVFQQARGGIEALFQALELQKAGLQAAAQVLTMYGGALAGLAEASRSAAVPLQVQAAAMAQLFDAAQNGVVGLKEHQSALLQMTQQLEHGIPLTKEQAAALEAMAVSMAEANRETLSTATAMETLAANQRAATAAIKDSYESLVLLATQMQAGQKVTKLQADALTELAARAKEGHGFTKEMADRLRDLSLAVQAGTALTKAQAAELQNLTRAFAEANKAALGFQQAQDPSKLQQFHLAAVGLAAALTLLGANLKGLLEGSVGLAARVETLGVVMTMAGKNTGVSTYEMRIQQEIIKSLGITSRESADMVISFAQAQLKAADASKLARVAQDLAVAAGMNSSDAAARLTQAIEAQSVMMLRAFGIVTTQTKIYDAYAQTIGKTADKLTEIERKQAFFNKIVKEGQEVAGAYEAAMNTAGKAQASLTRYVEESQVALGQALLPVMLTLVLTVTTLHKTWQGMSEGFKTFITAAAAGVTVMTMFAAALAGLNLLKQIELFQMAASAMRVFNAQMAASAGFTKALTTAMGGWNVVLLGIGAAIAIGTAAYIAWTKATENQTESMLKELAIHSAEIRKLEDAGKKYNDLQAAITKYTNEKTKLEAVSKRTAEQQAKLTLVNANLESKTKLLAQTQEDLIKKGPALVTFFDGQKHSAEELTRAIEKATEAELKLQKTRATGLVEQFKKLEDDVAAMNKKAEDAQAALKAYQEAKPATPPPSVGVGQAGAVAAALAQEGRLRDAVTETSQALDEAQGKLERMRPLVADALIALMPPAEREAAVRRNIENFVANWQDATKDWADRLAFAGKTLAGGMSLSMLISSKDIDEVKSRLGEVDRVFNEHLEKQRSLAKQIANARESVRKMGTTDPIELAKYDELNKMLGKLTVGSAQWNKMVELSRSLLNQYGQSAEVNTGKFTKLDATLQQMAFDKYLGVAPETIREYAQLNTVLGTVAEGSEEYNAILRQAAPLIEKYNAMTAAQKAKLADMLPFLTLVTASLKLYNAELEITAQKQNKLEGAAFARESAAAMSATVKELSESQQKAIIERRDAQIAADEAIRQSARQLQDDITASLLQGQQLQEYQLARQIEELQHRFEFEKAARKLAMADERRAMEDRIKMMRDEAILRQTNAIKQRELAIENARIEVAAQEKIAELYKDPARMERAQRAKQDIEVMVAALEGYRVAIGRTTSAELANIEVVAAGLRELQRLREEQIAANDKASAEITEKQIARQQEVLANMREGVQQLRELWQAIGDAFVDGFMSMITGAKSFKDAMIGVWKSILNAVTSIFAEMLKNWIRNLILMETAAKKTDLAGAVAGSIEDVEGGYDPTGRGGAGAAGGFAGAGNLFGYRSNPTGRQIVGGALSGGIVGGQVGYGVGRSTGSYTGGIAAGAGAGAAAGAPGGPIGIAIGAGVGAFMGWLGAKKARDEAAKDLKEYIKSWSGGMEEIKAKTKEARAEYELFKVTSAKTPEALAEAIEKLEKAFALLDAKKDLAHTEDQLVALDKAAQLVGYDLKKLYNAKTIEEFNREQEKLNKLLAEQQERLEALGSAAQGLEIWATGFTTTMQKGLQKAFPDAKQAEEFLKAYQDAVTKGFVGTYAEFAKIRRESEGVIASLEKVGTDAQQEFTALGITAAATFAGILHETGDVVQAMNAISPALDKLIEAMDQWGLNADDTFGSLIQFRRIIKDNEDIFQSLGGMTQALKGLSEAGWLTEEAFDAMGLTAVQKFDELVARTGDQRLALMSMQPTLQALWEAQKKYGFSVDESTQALIDQGVEQGIVGANMQSVNQKMLDVLGLIAQQLGVARDKLEAIGLTSEQNSGRVKAGLEDVGDAATDAGRHVAVARDELAKLQTTAATTGGFEVDPQTTQRINDLTTTVKTTVTTLKDAGEAGRGVGTDVQSGASDAVYGLDAIVRKAGEAEYALIRMGIAGEVAGQQIEAAATGAAEGHSPTGIKQITVRIKESEAAMRDFSTYFALQAQKIEQASADMVATREARDLPTMDAAVLGVQPVEPVAAPAASQSVTIQVTHEAPQISVNALDNANMEEAWRSKIMPEYLRHIDNNADQLAERTEAAISRHRRRA